MGGTKKSSSFSRGYYARLPKIEPYLLTDDDMKIDFTKTIQELRENKMFKLDNEAMLLRTPPSYKGTSEEQLNKLMASEVRVFSYHVERVKGGYYSLKREEKKKEDDKGDSSSLWPVNELLPEGVDNIVLADEEVATVEEEFWNKVSEEPSTVTEHDVEGGDEASDETSDDVDQGHDKDEDWNSLNKKKRKKTSWSSLPRATRVRRSQKEPVAVQVQAMNQEKEEGEFEVMKFLALYGTDNEGSLYDHRSEKFKMLRFPNILPQVTHRFSETVAGVTTPMLYIGKRYSPFPCHIEDNEAWSINYLHKGSPKIWYVLEVSCARFFEAAVKTDLESHIGKICSGCPCFLRHKSLLIHPSVLASKGYHVKKIVQRAGDIVVLPPRCYHWGFNVSDNLAEAINFTMPDSLPFGYVAINCPNKMKEHPIFSMEWFVWEREPERYSDYVNGKMNVIDPVSRVTCVVPAPTIKKTLDDDNVGLHSSGISEILAAKRQDGQDWIYINSSAGYTWMSRKIAQTLFWNTTRGEWPVKLTDELFSMHPDIIKKFPDITYCLQKGDDCGAEKLIKTILQLESDMNSMEIENILPHYDEDDANVFTEEELGQVIGSPTPTTTLYSRDHALELTETGTQTTCTTYSQLTKQRKPRRLKEKIPWEQVVLPPCAICHKTSKEFSSKSHWDRHLKSCSGFNKTPCPTCNKLVRTDDLTNHMRRHLR